MRKKFDRMLDVLGTFASFSVIVGLVWCLTPSLITFVIGLFTIASGTVFYILFSYFLCSKWKKLKDILNVSERSENDNEGGEGK